MFNMPEKALQLIVDAINKSKRLLAWPIQLCLNLNPCLGKVSGGYRTIAKTPMLHRLNNIINEPDIQTWESIDTSEHDSSKKGSSALIAAAESSLLAELAYF